MLRYIKAQAWASFGLAALLTLGWGTLASKPIDAQILLVTGNYRVTELDQEHERFGVALPNDNPNVTQNWVYVAPSTKFEQRLMDRHGWHKEQKLNYFQFFEQVKPGTLLRVHGGRRWDGGISGKHIWFGSGIGKTDETEPKSP